MFGSLGIGIFLKQIGSPGRPDPDRPCAESAVIQTAAAAIFQESGEQINIPSMVVSGSPKRW